MPRKSKGKTGETGLEKDLEGTAEIGMDLREQGRSQSGFDDDIFGFKAELGGKKKGKKGSVEDSIGNIYGNFDV